MEIEIFTLCDFAQDTNGKLTIVGTFDSIQSKQFPCTHPACTVTCRLRFSEKEAGSHHFRLRFTDSEASDLMKPVEGQISISNPRNGQFSAVNLVFNFNQLKFEKSGRYSFELFIDEEWKSGLPLFLTQVS